eukprot:2152930-Ditylum_brightwellii.AAC.1
MVPTSKQSNSDVKQAVIAFQKPSPRQLECGQYQTYKLHNTPQTLHHPSTSSLYLSLMREHLKSGLSSGVGYRQCSRVRMSHRVQQAMQLLRPFSRAMC